MHRACCWSALAISWPCMQRVHAWPHSPTTMQAPWPITGHRHDQPSIACCLSTCSRCLPSMISTVPSSATPRLQHSNHGTRLHATSHAQHGSHTRLHASSHASSSTGSRAAGLPVVWHPMYSAPQLSPGHRFPMQVFGRIYERLLQQNIIHPDQIHQPPELLGVDQLCRVHTREYVEAFLAGTLDSARARRIGLGASLTSQPLIQRTQWEVAGTLLTARLALAHGLAVNTAGGTHHAFPDAGAGYCVLNDLAVTTKVLLSEGRVSRVLVCDLDVHQGDGTAVCLADEPGAFTLSFHCESNFPARKQSSSLDVGLPDGTGDDEFLGRLADVLPDVIQSFRPDLVLYDAGVDTHAADALGRLSLSDAGLRRREALVLETCLSAGVPVAGYVGGGYDDDLDVLAERHMVLHRVALEMWRDYEL